MASHHKCQIGWVWAVRPISSEMEFVRQKPLSISWCGMVAETAGTLPGVFGGGGRQGSGVVSADLSDRQCSTLVLEKHQTWKSLCVLLFLHSAWPWFAVCITCQKSSSISPCDYLAKQLFEGIQQALQPFHTFCSLYCS